MRSGPGRNRGLVTLGSKDRNLESPRKSTLDFQEAGRDNQRFSCDENQESRAALFAERRPDYVHSDSSELIDAALRKGIDVIAG